MRNSYSGIHQLVMLLFTWPPCLRPCPFDQNAAMLCVRSAGILCTLNLRQISVPDLLCVKWAVVWACLPLRVSGADSALRLVEEVPAPADHSGLDSLR
eukprot:3112597-Amphidinium_carterae.2